MKTCLYIAILLALVAVGSAYATQVTKVDLLYADGGTVARIEVQGPYQFTHTAVEPKDGKPNRLIVDVLGATHNWGPKEWASLPNCGVKVVRIGQYSSKPDKVVRLVFELTKAPIYRVDSDGKSINVHFTDNTVKQFAAWSSGQAPAEPPVIAPVTPTTAATQPAVNAPVTPKPATPSVALAPKPEVKPSVPAEKPITTHTTLAKTPPATVPGVTPQVTPTQKPTVVAQAEKPAAPVAPKVDEKKAVVETSKPIVSNPAPSTPAAAPKRTAPSVPAPTSPATAAISKPAPAPAVTQAPSKPAPTVATSQPAQPKTDAAKPAEQPAVKPPVPIPLLPKTTTVASAPEVKPALASTPAKPEAQKPVVATTAPAPAAKAPEVKPADPKAADAKAPAVASTATPATTPTDKPAPAGDKPADAASAATPSDKSLLADADTPTDGSASGSARPTARFRRTASNKMKSSLVAEFPQRLVVKYESMGYRDPFATLIDDTKTYDEPLVQRVPNVDGLKLVGVIESPDGDNRALFEDKHKFSYILKSGDKVQRGYVLRVEDDRVYFQIFEYGWSRTIALTLENRN